MIENYHNLLLIFNFIRLYVYNSIMKFKHIDESNMFMNFDFDNMYYEEIDNKNYHLFTMSYVFNVGFFYFFFRYYCF